MNGVPKPERYFYHGISCAKVWESYKLGTLSPSDPGNFC